MSKKYPGVYESDKKGFYHYSFKYTDNERKRRTCFGRGYTSAKKCYEDKESRKRQIEKEIQFNIVSSDDMTFKELKEKFYQENILTNKKRTADVYSERIAYLLPYLENKIFRKISVLDIQKVKQKLLDDGISKNYINMIMHSTSVMLNYAKRVYKLEFNVIKESGKLKVDRVKKEMSVWGYNEFKTFINVIEDLRWKAFFTLLYLTGVRKGEALALTWNDVGFSANKINIDKTYFFEELRENNTLPKTFNSIRKVTLDNETIVVLKELHKLDSSSKFFKSTNYIFIKNGKPFAETTIDKTKERLINKSGVTRITCHGFRHSHVSYLISLGATVPYIAKRIGDTIQMVYKTYSHMLPSEEQEVINKMDNNYNKYDEK